MRKFTFNFEYNGGSYDAECEPIPLDGTTALYITPLNDDLFNRYGTKILAQTADGRLTTTDLSGDEERRYLVAVGQGLVAHYNGEQRTSG